VTKPGRLEAPPSAVRDAQHAIETAKDGKAASPSKARNGRATAVEELLEEAIRSTVSNSQARGLRQDTQAGVGHGFLIARQLPK
jgi:hypothetical protein